MGRHHQGGWQLTEESYDAGDVSESRLPTETKARPPNDHDPQKLIEKLNSQNSKQTKTHKSKSQTKYQIPRKSVEMEAQPPRQTQINVPKFVGKYQLQEIVGRGAHGRVFKAFDTETGQNVAIKLMGLNRFNVDMKQSITYEIDLLKRLDNCNIVKYIDTVQSGQYLCIVLEFIEGGSLENLLARLGCFSETLAAVYIEQVLKGLDYLHRQGVIHRDIKGGNILVTLDGVVKLADFGVATKLTDAVKNISFAGTPYWMAPEVIEMSGHVTSVCDIWSVGCTVFELLTGKPPYYNMNQFPAMIKIVKEQMPLPEDISPELKDFLQKCFIKDPKNRPDARTMLRHEWFVKQSDQKKLAQILAQNPPLEVSNTIKIHLNEHGQRIIDDQKKIKKVIQDGKLVSVKRSSSSGKNPVPLAQNAVQKTKSISRVNNQKRLNESQKQHLDDLSKEETKFELNEQKHSKEKLMIKSSHLQLTSNIQFQKESTHEQERPIITSKTPTSMKLVQKPHQPSADQPTQLQIKKLTTQKPSKVQNISANTDHPQKVIPYAKIQQACKNAALKFKKINLVTDKIQQKTTVVKEFPTSSMTTDVQAIQQSIVNAHNQHQALIQSKSFQDVHSNDQDLQQIFPKPQPKAVVYDLRTQNPKRSKIALKNSKSEKTEIETESQLVTEHSAYKQTESRQYIEIDSETQSKKTNSRNKARMIGRGFSMLAASCLTQQTQLQTREADEMIAQEPGFPQDLLSRVGNDQTKKENTRQNSGITKQVASLLHQHQSFDQPQQNLLQRQHQSNQSYLTHANSHHSNQSYHSNGTQKIPVQKPQMIGHGHSSTFENSFKANSILHGVVTASPSNHNLSSDFAATVDQSQMLKQRIGSQNRLLQKNNSTNILQATDYDKKGSQKIAASFLNQFQAEELSQRQVQLFNKPNQTLGTPDGSQNDLLMLKRGDQREFEERKDNQPQFQVQQENRTVQRTVSYGGKFAAAGPASSQQAGFQNNNQRAAISGKSVDFFRMPQTQNFVEKPDQEDQIAQKIKMFPSKKQKSPKRMLNDDSIDEANDIDTGINRIESQTFDNRKPSKPEPTAVGGSEKTTRQTLTQNKDMLQLYFDQATSLSTKLIMLVGNKNKEYKEIIKVIKQLIKLLEDITIAFSKEKHQDQLMNKYRSHILNHVGAVTLIQLLKHPKDGVAYASLQFLNQLSERDPQKQKLLVTAGLIPHLIRLCLTQEMGGDQTGATQREMKVEIAYFIGQVFQDSKQHLLDVYLSCGGYKIQLAFLELEYSSNTDLIMIAIDSFLVIFDECQQFKQQQSERKRSNSRESKEKEIKRLQIDPSSITSLLITEGITSRLVGLMPQIIRHAASQTDQSTAETILERIFDVLHHLAQFSNYQDKKQMCKKPFQDYLCRSIFESLKEPLQLTLQTTRQFIKLVQSLTIINASTEQTIQVFDKYTVKIKQASVEIDSVQQQNLIKKLGKLQFVQVQVEILCFYVSSIAQPDGVQLSSIYEQLKLLNMFLKMSQDRCLQALENNGLVTPLKRLLVYIDTQQEHISLSKRVRLLNLVLSLINELVVAAEVARMQLTEHEVYEDLLLLLKSAQKFSSVQLTSTIGAAPDSASNASIHNITNGFNMHLNQQSQQRIVNNELALRVMDIFVVWIQKEDRSAQVIQRFLAQKRNLEAIFNVFISLVKRNPTELLTFLISLHKMLLSSDLLVDSLLQKDLLVSHLQSQMVLLCNQIYILMSHNKPQLVASATAGNSFTTAGLNAACSNKVVHINKSGIFEQYLDSNLITQNNQIDKSQNSIAVNTIQFDNQGKALNLTQGPSSAKSVHIPPALHVRESQSVTGFYDKQKTNIMLSSLTGEPIYVQGPKTAKQVQKLSYPEQQITTQQAAYLLKELLEIFSLLLSAKKSQSQHGHYDFTLKFDLGNTVSMIHRTAQRRQLVVLQELSSNLLSEIFPDADDNQFSPSVGQSPSQLSGTFNLRQSYQQDDFEGNNSEDDSPTTQPIMAFRQAQQPIFNLQQRS